MKGVLSVLYSASYYSYSSYGSESYRLQMCPHRPHVTASDFPSQCTPHVTFDTASELPPAAVATATPITHVTPHSYDVDVASPLPHSLLPRKLAIRRTSRLFNCRSLSIPPLAGQKGAAWGPETGFYFPPDEHDSAQEGARHSCGSFKILSILFGSLRATKE